MKFTKKYEYEIEINEEKLFQFVEQLKKDEDNYFWPVNEVMHLNGIIINNFPWQVQIWAEEAFENGCFKEGLDCIKINDYLYDGFDQINSDFGYELYEDLQEAIVKLIVEKETKNA